MLEYLPASQPDDWLNLLDNYQFVRYKLVSKNFNWGKAIVLRSNLGNLEIGTLRVPGKQRRQGLAMESTEKKYIEDKVRRSDSLRDSYASRTKQIFALVSMVGFAGSAIFGIVSLFTSGLSSQHQQKPVPAAAVSQESLLAAQEREYETVLRREPQNQTALEGLANVRLEMNNKLGAIEPLEKLVKLNPGRSDYQALLGQAKGKK
ncbi:tetratricopeptide repeat protein [Microcoleus sp. A006_D1]|uniref:tetratricopeptide repeat protein n=1 Tax=Microcoleus sp. A006_D1 TaxID=3055267 RepID=UPI002FD15721